MERISSGLIPDNIFSPRTHLREKFLRLIFSVRVTPASKYDLTVTSRQTNKNLALNTCPSSDFKEPGMGHITTVEWKLSKILTFQELTQSCLVSSMTTKHIFQFIQWDFKGFHKAECGGGFSSCRAARYSSIEVKTWKSPKLQSHFSQPLLVSPSANWRRIVFLLMLVDAYMLLHAIRCPLQNLLLHNVCDVHYNTCRDNHSRCATACAQDSPGWSLFGQGSADWRHKNKLQTHSLLLYRETRRRLKML